MDIRTRLDAIIQEAAPQLDYPAVDAISTLIVKRLGIQLTTDGEFVCKSVQLTDDELDVCGLGHDRKGPAQEQEICPCRHCLNDAGIGFTRMVVCSECGNKRCPHANDHRNACTGSNEPGQPGSAYA